MHQLRIQTKWGLAWLCMLWLVLPALAVPSGHLAFSCAITGADESCVNQLETYTVTTPLGGYTYTWSTSPGGTPSGTTGTGISVSWTAAGGQWVALQAAAPGGGTTVCTLLVTIYPRPTPVILSDFISDCDERTEIQSKTIQEKDPCWVVCEYMTITYETEYVPGNTYQWVVVGGTPLTATGPSVNVTWGPTGSGFVILTETAPGGCSETVEQCVDIVESPDAWFAFNGQDPTSALVICSEQVVYFNDQSVGAASWYWEFGDGTTSVLQNPQHTYPAPGTYYGTLTVTNECGCTSSIDFIVKVTPEVSPIIGCISTVCLKDCAFYSVTNICAGGNITWSINGGQITSQPSAGSINVVWDDVDGFIGANGYGEICATVTGCDDLCDGEVCVRVPVIHPVTISGETVVCVGDPVTYSVPVQPGINEPGQNPPNGVAFDWVVTGGIIISPTPHSNTITVQWFSAGTQTITLNGYNNPSTGSKCDMPSAELTVEVKPRFSISPLQATICLGDSQVFTPNPSDTYNWTINGVGGMTGPFTQTGPFTATPTAAGVYAVTAQSNSGMYCNATPSAVLQVVEAPPMPSGSLVGESVVCLNMPYTYSYSATPPSGAVFVWDIVGGTLFNDVGPTVTAEWTGGTMTLSVRLRTTEEPFCESAPVVFTISEYTPPANFVSGPTSVCVDELHSYDVSGLSNYTNLVWSVSPATSGSVVTGHGTPNIEVLFTNTPTPPVTVECTATVCGVDITHALPVTVNQIPNYAISAPAIVCQSELVGLSVTPATGIASYVWDFGDGNGSTSPTPNHAWSAPGTYSVTAALTLSICGGPTVVVATTIQVDPKPIAYVTATNGFVVCLPNQPSTTLIAASQTFCNYTWSTGATGPTLFVTSAGTYTVTATDPVTGCSAVITRVVQGCPPGPPCVSAATPWNFTYTENCDTYTFVPVSSGNSNYIGWNFGDNTGSSSSGTQVHTYDHPGYYQVTIFSYDPVDQCTLAIVKTITVKFKGKFKANFDCSSGTMMTTLTDISEYLLPDFPPGTRQWFDGGLSIGTGPSISVNLSPGVHNIYLQVTIAGQTCVSPTEGVDVPGLPDALFTHNAPVCEGFPVLFSNTSTGAIGYAWDFGDGAGSGLTSPERSYSASGSPYTATLTVNSAWGCSDVATSSVTILPHSTPPAIAIAPPPPVCAGTPVVLTAGTLPSPATYTWYNAASPGTPLQGPAPANTYTAGLSGLYGVSATDGNGCTYNVLANEAVVITPAPYIHFSGKTDYCFGETMVISADIGPNYSYAWSVTTPWGTYTPPALPSVTLGANPLGTFTFFVTITDNNTGCTNSGSTTTTVHSGPTGLYISADASCAPATLTANVSGATQINWSNGATGTTTYVVQGGYYSVIATNAFGCTATNDYYLQDRPDLSNVMTGCYDFCDRVYWQAPSCFGCTYQWTLNGSPIPGETNSTILIGNSGVYTVIVSNGPGCESESDPIDISIVSPDLCKKCRVEVKKFKFECVGTDPQTGLPIYEFWIDVVNSGGALYGLSALSNIGTVTMIDPSTGFLPGGGALSTLHGYLIWDGSAMDGCIRFSGFLTSDCDENEKCEFQWCGELPKCCEKDCDIDIVDRRVECLSNGFYRISLTIKNSGCALTNMYLKTPYAIYPFSPSTLSAGTLATLTTIIAGTPGPMVVYACGTLPNGKECCRGVQLWLPECPPTECKLDEGRNGISCIGFSPDGHPMYHFIIDVVGVPPGSTIHVLPNQAGVVNGVTYTCSGLVCTVQGTFTDYSHSSVICFSILSISADEEPKICEGKVCLQVPDCPEPGRPASARNDGQTTLQEHAASAFVLAPNPATNEVRIVGVEVAAEMFEVRVTDMVGKHNRIIRVATNNPVLDISQLPAGVYIVTIADGKGQPVSRKLTVMK